MVDPVMHVGLQLPRGRLAPLLLAWESAIMESGMRPKTGHQLCSWSLPGVAVVGEVAHAREGGLDGVRHENLLVKVLSKGRGCERGRRPVQLPVPAARQGKKERMGGRGHARR